MKEIEYRGLQIVSLVIVAYVVLIITIKLVTNHEEVRLFSKVSNKPIWMYSTMGAMTT